MKINLKGGEKILHYNIVHKDQLVGGVYLCDQNEFDEKNWGQLHYAFMNDHYKGMGLYSILFKEAVIKARKLNFEGLILNSDRYMLPELYIKWGAVSWKSIKKVKYKGPNIFILRLIKKIFKKVLKIKGKR